MLQFTALFLGIIIGATSNFTISSVYSPYVAVAILACLDSVLGGYVANLSGKFNLRIFASGLFCNALLAAGLGYMGKILGVDQINIATIVVFGTRIFSNAAILRRVGIEKLEGWWVAKRQARAKVEITPDEEEQI